MIEVKNLTKKYGSHTAVNGISFTIENGKIYGLLGPNGAGKSTTMNIVTGCLAATSGTVLVDGHDVFEEPTEAKKHIGYLPELPPLYPEMTPQEYLTFVSEAKGVSFEERSREIRSVMALTGIDNVKDRLIKNLSKGYKQRVGIAQAMIGNPDTIILDEPTVGLDPKQIIEIRKLISELGKKKTIIISSHILAEISAVCDQVIIISHGKIVADDSLEDLETKASRKNGLSIAASASVSEVKKVLDGLAFCDYRELEEHNGVVSTTLTPAADYVGKLTDDVFFAFANAKLPLCEMIYRESSLESIFLALTENPDYLPDAIRTYTAESDAEEKETVESEEAEDSDISKDVSEDDYKLLFSGKDEEDDK